MSGLGDKYDAVAAVNFALSGQPFEFENMIKAGLADRIIDAVDGKREEVARGMFFNAALQPAEEHPVDNDQEEEVSTEEVAQEDGEETS